MSRFFFLSVCFSIASSALGQQSPPEGALEDTEFLIKKDRKNLLPEASRLFDKAPNLPRIIDPIVPLEYTLPDLFPEFDTLSNKIKILRAKQDIVPKLYSNYVRGGHGNFYMPFLEGFFANKYNSQYTYGCQIRHLSAGKKTYAEETHNLIQLQGRLFTETICLGGAMDYHRDGYQLYSPGHSTSAVPRRQIVQQLTLRNTLGNHIRGPLNYQVDTTFYYLFDAYKARENQWQFNGRGDYALDDTLTLKAFTNLYLTKYSDTTAVRRHLWRFKPMLYLMFNSFDVSGGLNLVYQDDVSYAPNSLDIYPVLEVKYALRKWLQPYLGISGDMQQNYLQDLLQENPLLAPQADLRHTNQRFSLYGGAKGDIMAQVNWHAGFSVGMYQNLHCLVNSEQDPSKFDVKYDSEARVTNVFGELIHTNRAETFTTRLRGDYFHYTLQELSKPWHRPRYQLDLLSTYRLYDKFVCKGTMYWIGGLEAQNVTTKAPVVLDDVVDIDLGIEYLWNSRLSIFCNCQNLLARKNEYYLHYPTRGLHLMLGLTYAW